MTYKIECATDQFQDKSLISGWRELLKNSTSTEKLYQTPEFFDYILNTNFDGSDQAEIITVKHVETGKLVGIIPIRLRNQQVAFRLAVGKNINFFTPTIVLLGSEPLLPMDTKLYELVLQFLFQQFPKCQAISLPAMNETSDFWIHSKELNKLYPRYLGYVLNGWRDCHQIPLPMEFATYLQQFSTKRRYNLNRQIRLLRESGDNKLALFNIETIEDIYRLEIAIQALVPINDQTNILSITKLSELARRGLLLCYVLERNKRPCALILGTKSSNVLHLHNIFCDPALTSFSVGTSIMHMAIENLCEKKNLRVIDLGYGTPSHSYQSTNITTQRGHLLIFKKNLRNFCLSNLHKLYGAAVIFIKKILQKKKSMVSKAFVHTQIIGIFHKDKKN